MVQEDDESITSGDESDDDGLTDYSTDSEDFNPSGELVQYQLFVDTVLNLQ